MNQIFLIFCLACFLHLCWSSGLIVLKPNDPFVFLGECLTLYCSLSSLTYGNSSTLYITFKGQHFSKDHYEIVNATTMKFNTCLTDLNESGTYFCKKTKVNNETELHFNGQVVRVEKALVPIPKDSIQCLVMNWASMNCTWSLGQTYKDPNEIQVDLTFVIIRSYDPVKCPKLLQTSCRWERQDADFSMPFLMNLTVSHKRRPGEKVVTAFELPRNKLVKPSRVKLSGNALFSNISCFKIKWKHRFAYKLTYNVTIYSKNEGKETILRKEKYFEMCNLLPGEKYKVGISAFPKSPPGIWSDPLLMNIETNGTYPSQPPAINNSNFLWQAHSGVRLFWQSLTRRQSGTEKVWYLVDVDNQTKQASSGQTVIKLPLHKPGNKCWILQIWAENDLGRSKSSSKIEICNDTSVPVAVEMVEILILNSTFVEVMWKKPSIEKSPASQFKVLACRNCSVDLQWWVLDANKSSVILQLDQPNDYTFAVAVENQNGSSGLTFGYCYFYMNTCQCFLHSTTRIGIHNRQRHGYIITRTFIKETKEKKPRTPIAGFSVQTIYDKLQVVWDSYNCMNEKAFIIGYQVNYCVALNNSLCNEGVKVSSVPRSQRKFETTKLSPNDYLVWMEPVTYGGSGPSSIKQMVTITNSSLSTSKIVGIAVGSFVAFLLIIVGCKSIYDKFALQMAECDPKIEFPQIIQDKDSGIIFPNSNSSSISDPDSSPTCSTQTDITHLSTNSHCDASMCNGVAKDSDQHTYMKITIDNNDSLGRSRQSSPTLSQEFTKKQNANNNAVNKDDYVDPNAFDNLLDQSGSNSHHTILDDDNISFSDSNSLLSLNTILGKFSTTGDDALANKFLGVKHIQENNQNCVENEGINRNILLTEGDLGENIPSVANLYDGKVIAPSLKEQIVQNGSMANFEIDAKTNPTEILKDNSMQVGVHHSGNKDACGNISQLQKNLSLAYVSNQNASDYVVVTQKEDDYIETSAFSSLSDQSGSSTCSHDQLLNDNNSCSSSFSSNDDNLNEGERAVDATDNNVSNVKDICNMKSILPNLRNDSPKMGFCKNEEITQILSPTETSLEKSSLTDESNKDSSKVGMKNGLNFKNNSSPRKETITDQSDAYIFVDDKQNSDATFSLNAHCVKKAQAKQINAIPFEGNHSYELHELSQKV